MKDVGNYTIHRPNKRFEKIEQLANQLNKSNKEGLKFVIS